MQEIYVKPKITRFAKGAGEATYREIIHASPVKLEKIRKLLGVSSEKLHNLNLDVFLILDLIKIKEIETNLKRKIEKILFQPENVKDLPCCCERCGCEKHQCPNRIVHCEFTFQHQTVYKRDFKKFDPSNNTNDFQYNVNKQERINVSHEIDPWTTYKKSYPGFISDGQKADRKSDEFPVQKEGIKFKDQTTYKNEFMNWGKANNVSMNLMNRTYSLPFKGTSSYKAAFQNHSIQPRMTPFRKS